MKRILSLVALLITFISLATPVVAVTTTVYDALPSVIPDTSYPSQAFQAQQTSEFGDLVHLGGTGRTLNNITVTMVTWAKFADYSENPNYMGNSNNWNHPITLNIYSSHLGNNGVPDTKLGTITKSVSIPWRPKANSSCPDLKWLDSTGKCNNGYAFNANFDLSSLNVTLPDDIIVGVAYNTQSYGVSPIGIDGPYNSLNVAVPPSQVVSIGSDISTDKVFWNTITASSYTDGGVAGVGIFREDNSWTPYGTVAMRIQVTASLIDKDQCKKDGWKNFSNPSFKNQGDCVSFLEKNHHEDDTSQDKCKSEKKDYDKDQCKKDGWKNFSNPSFKNQGDCVSFLEKKEKDSDKRCQETKLVLVDTVVVPANLSSATSTNIPLESGKKYIIESSGTWTNSLNLADTEYVSQDSWSTWVDGYNFAPWMLGLNEFDLQIDGGFVDWGAYNSTHVYKYSKTGSGAKVSFLIFDGDSVGPTLHPEWYGDNQGSLTIKIFKVE